LFADLSLSDDDNSNVIHEEADVKEGLASSSHHIAGPSSEMVKSAG
jgi:hypothetical protein